MRGISRTIHMSAIIMRRSCRQHNEDIHEVLCSNQLIDKKVQYILLITDAEAVYRLIGLMLCIRQDLPLQWILPDVQCRRLAMPSSPYVVLSQPRYL